MKRALARAIAAVAPTVASGGIRTLLYHAIGERDPHDSMRLRVTPQRFIEQMTVLRDEGYTVVPLSTVADPMGDRSRRRIAITFDDGYRSDAWAATMLREFGFTATFFVVPRFLDGRHATTVYWENWEHLRWDEIAALAEQGFDIGAHSATHSDLTACPDARLHDEVSGARALLEQRLGRPVLNFSYPFGRHDHRVRRAVAAAGYELGCTSRYGLNQSSGRSYAVYRTEVGSDDDLNVFRAKLQGKYDWLGYWQALTSWRRPRTPTT